MRPNEVPGLKESMNAFIWKTATQKTRTVHQHRRQVSAEWRLDVKGTIGQTSQPSLCQTSLTTVMD